MTIEARPRIAAPSASELDRHGFAIVRDVLASSEVSELLGALQDEAIVQSKRRQTAYGGRNLLRVAAIRSLSQSRRLHELIEPLVGKGALPVRGLFFDKTPEANWPVPWHQDLNIALSNRVDEEGWKNWTFKSGVHQVQAPPSILERMITVRLHLDDCGADSGPLRVIPGSHRRGRLTQEQSAAVRHESDEFVCAAPVGSALLMRPLLLHASSPARQPSHRRVVHIEFAEAEILPDGMHWAFN